ncbi:electron transport complex subunit RsxC [Tropicimonas isoalkanivorans]|uniref:Ion-translocating oxidoreductase complex subunit C n=1 Tax=Tropicimonas isoalkanivorans TaxID=441112 RepID=A0A1I1H8W1_9RHOB|nr:electron transport complex subunit RsxC [Tropicimonas isoalkanivorans]SFC20135.1 electron transport complex protein RnfC [Tropicimonas isoalkanivorans]
MKLFSLAALKRTSDIFAIRGGIHPETRKYLSAQSAIEQMPLPSLIRVPLQQHVGAEAVALVKRDDRVLKGQLIGKARGAISANVHAPTSGRVIAVGHFAAPHPSGLPVATITIRPDGKDEWGPRMPRLRPEDADPNEIAERVMEAGIVGMGGAVFPAAVKLNQRERYDLHTLVINGSECEPYLTCDDRLLRERAEEIADGIRILARAVGVKKVIIAIEANKPEAIEAMRRHTFAIGPEARVTKVPTLYPMGSAQHLVKAVTGLEVPARARTAELGVLVHNVATAYAVHKAVRYGEPLISRVMTVSGQGVKRPANVEALIGTPVSDILKQCGGLTGEPDRLLLGGPMMGLPILSLRVPVIKGTSGILALMRTETRPRAEMPCIRCGGCVKVCPCGLMPMEMHARIQADDLDGAVDLGLPDCISCGSCSFNCPSNIQLVQGFNYALGRLAVKQSQKHQQEETKRLAAARTARMDAIAEKKRAAMAKRKAEMAAKKKREAEAAAEAGAARPNPQEAAE